MIKKFAPIITFIIFLGVVSYFSCQVESYCLDWETNEELGFEICAEADKCKEHCERKNMSYGWNSCCVTDGGCYGFPPRGVNIQGCDCE